MKTVLQLSGITAMVMAVGLLFSGCYTQIGTVRDESSPYDQYTTSDDTTAQSYSNDQGQNYNYDDNFYGYNSFNRYRFFSFYYPTYYWNWAYDPWYDYTWNNPWYNPWYGGGYYPYYGGFYGGYSPYYPWYPSGSGVWTATGSNGARSPFGQGRGGVATMAPGRGGRNGYQPGYVQTPTVDLPPAATVQSGSRAGAAVRSTAPAPAQQPRGTAVSRPSGNSGSRPNATPSKGSGNRSHPSGRQYTPPPAPAPSHDGGSRGSGGERSGGGGGGERGGGGGGGHRGGGGRGR